MTGGAGRQLSTQLFNLGADNTVARLGAKSRGREPAAKNTFSCHAGLLHYPGRGQILGVTEGPGAKNIRLLKQPVHQVAQRLGHQALAPMGPAEGIGQQGVAAVEVDRDRPDGCVGLAQAKQIRIAGAFLFPVVGPGLKEFLERVRLRCEAFQAIGSGSRPGSPGARRQTRPGAVVGSEVCGRAGAA